MSPRTVTSLSVCSSSALFNTIDPSMFSLKLFLFVCFVALTSTELVQYKPCYAIKDKPRLCTVKDVKIEPCPEAAKNEPCRIKRGEVGSIAFKYTLDFDPVGSLQTRAYWVSALADVPFIGMDTDACKSTDCPVAKNVEKNFNFTLDISKTFPAQKFDVKWKIWEDKAGPERECCFIIKMRLI